MKNIILPLLALTASVVAANAQLTETDADTNTKNDTSLTRLARVESGTATAWQWTLGTEGRLAAEPGSPAAAALPQAVREAQEAHSMKNEELARLLQRLADLRAALDADNETNANSGKLTRELDEKIKSLKAELAELAKKEAELMRKLTDDNQATGLTAGVDAGDRKPIAVVLRHGFVAPLASPYFVMRRLNFNDGDRGIELIAKQDGVAVGQALETGGWLAKKLEEATPEKNYLVVMVAADSVETYYALVKEARRRKLRHSWDTWDGESFYIITQSANGNNGGGGGKGIETF